MHTHNDDLTHNDLVLVDLDDLRAAFGGQGSSAPQSDAQAEPVPTTVMCPQW